MAEPFVTWVIYERPADYPNGYVLRRHLAYPGRLEADPNAQYFRNLHEARSALPAGLFRMDRHPADDPCIKETWI